MSDIYICPLHRERYRGCLSCSGSGQHASIPWDMLSEEQQSAFMALEGVKDRARDDRRKRKLAPVPDTQEDER